MTYIFTNNDYKQEIELISISDAIQLNFGRIKVQGIITSISKLYKLISKVKIYCDKCHYLTEEEFEVPISNLSFAEKKCKKCNKFVKNVADYDYVNAINLELQDVNSFNDIDRLSIVLLNEDTKKISVGEKVNVIGNIHIINNNKKVGSKLFPCLFAESIRYENREEIDLTRADVKAIERFAKINDSKVIDKLVSMVNPSVIKCRDVKEGLLLSAVNTKFDNLDEYTTNTNKKNTKIRPLQRERINILLIGDPGLGKSLLLKSGVKIVLNSRYESGENSSGKSLTAIVSKEEDNYVLRCGPAVLAKGAICGLNEISKMTFEDQGHLLSIMEEGEFTINKHGINAPIKAPTTIIASANPVNVEWKDNEKIDINEIVILRPLVDRFDLVFVFRKPKDKKEIREYEMEKSKLESKCISDYPIFLIKYIEYAKRLEPIFSDEAKMMLTEFFVQISSNGFGSYRIRDTLLRLAKARARLKLKNIVDEQDARETMEFYNMMLLQYQQVVNVISNPREITYNQCVAILREVQVGISLEELTKRVCERDEQIKNYLNFGNDKSLRLRDNKKVRDVYEMLLNHKNVKRIQEKPVVLQWFECDGGDNKDNDDQDSNNSSNKTIENISTINNDDECDLYDLCDRKNSISNDNKSRGLDSSQTTTTDIENGSQRSHWSHSGRNDDFPLDKNIDINKKQHMPQQLLYCNHCNTFTSSKENEIISHCINKHPSKPAQPNKKLLELLGLQSKGNPWEN
jgi:replicative DNA helicase Mcm